MPFDISNPWFWIILTGFLSISMIISGKRVPSAVARSRRNTAVTQKHHDLRFDSIEAKSIAMANANKQRRKRQLQKRNAKRHQIPF